MTQTIEQLTARVRDLEEENARLKETLVDHGEIQKSLCENLSASQAYAEQLREALETLNKVSNIGCDRVEKALALPRDTSALDVYVAEKVKPFRDSERKVSDAYLRIRKLVGAWITPKAPTPEQVYEHTEKCVSTLTRQRDNLLAQVDLTGEAMEAVKGCFDAAEFEGLSDRIREANVECGSLADLVMRRLYPALSTVEHALSAIKESEN